MQKEKNRGRMSVVLVKSGPLGDFGVIRMYVIGFVGQLKGLYPGIQIIVFG